MGMKELVKEGKKVRFAFFRGRDLWYRHEDGFEFPVPIDDVGDAVFLAEDRAMLFMRWMKKHAEAVAAAKTAQFAGAA